MSKGFGSKMKNISDTNLLLTITIVVFFLMYIGAMLFLGEGFLKPQALFNILNANAALIILSCGMSIVMITGGIDISVGGVTALISMCCAVYLDKAGGSVAVSVLIALLIGLGFGLVQASWWLTWRFSPSSYRWQVCSLPAYDDDCKYGTLQRGKRGFVALKNTRIIVPGMGSVNRLGNYVDAYVEIGVIVALLIVILLFCVLKWTKLGRNFYAVGGNSQSALMLGINVKRTKFIAHLLCGVLAGVGGFVYFLHVGSGSPSHASGAEMNAIASSIIGGTMLTGGVGNIIGTFFGVLSLSTIQNIVSSAGLDQAWWTGITVAAMLCLFLVIQSVVMAARKKGNVK